MARIWIQNVAFNTSVIHTSFTYRKLNMDEICGLKFYLLCVHTSQKILLKSLHAQRWSFLVLNLYLDLNPHFYEVNQEVWKRPRAWRNFKNIFCVLSTYPKKTFRTEKPSIFNFRYVKEVWASGLLGVNAQILSWGKDKSPVVPFHEITSQYSLFKDI